MADREHINLGVGFYPDWWHRNYGLSFGREYYFDPIRRVETRMAMDKALHERYGDVGLGDPDPEPKPIITFGMVMLPAVFGCEIIYEDEALPWAMPLNLSEEQCRNLRVPDLASSKPMDDVLRQIEVLKSEYGRVVGDINTTGVQNLALKLRGDSLYMDYFENPELARDLLDFCAESMIQLFKLVYPITGTGSVDVTPMCDPTLYCLPNCTVEQISGQTYEDFLLGPDNTIADEFQRMAIHHCGSVDHVLEGYSKVRHLEFLEVGPNSDLKRLRETVGPEVAINARISPVLMKNGSAEEVAAEVRRLISLGDPLENFSIDTVGITHGAPDENIRAARRAAMEYGKLD